MGQITGLHEVLAIAIARGLGENWISAEHDVIYLPFDAEDDPDAERLKALGCHWDGSVDSWAMFT